MHRFILFHIVFRRSFVLPSLYLVKYRIDEKYESLVASRRYANNFEVGFSQVSNSHVCCQVTLSPSIVSLRLT